MRQNVGVVRPRWRHALGALAYQMAYGDGTSDQNSVPNYCASGPGAPASQTWKLPHSYAKTGTYRATVTLRALPYRGHMVYHMVWRARKCWCSWMMSW